MMKRILCVMLLSVMTILGFMDKPCASKMISTMNHNNWQSFILRECPAYTLLYQFSPKDTGQSKVK